MVSGTEVQVDDAEVEEGQRIAVSHKPVGAGGVARIVGDVVEIAADRITVEVPKDFGHDKRYTIHMPNVDRDVALTKLYGHKDGRRLDHPAEEDLPAPAGYDSVLHTVLHVDGLQLHGKKCRVEPVPEQEPRG
jgi:hypothetical protein